MTATTKPVTPADIRAKLEQIRGEVDHTAEAARPTALAVAGVAAVVVVTVVYLIGRRRGRRSRTVVEVRRL